MRRRMIALSVLVALNLPGLSLGRSASAPSSESTRDRPAGCRYDVTATLDAGLTTVSAVTQVSYRNDSSDALEDLVFHFKPAEDDSREPRTLPTVSCLADDAEPRPLTISYPVSKDRSSKDQFIVRLPKPLKPGQWIRLRTTSECRIIDRWGMKNVEGAWHPRILHRSKEGWVQGIDAFADYRVTVGPLPQALLPTSGQVVEQRKDEVGRWTLTSQATNIPDFAMVFSKVDFSVCGTAEDVAIRCFYRAGKDKEAAGRMLVTAQDVIRFYHKMYGYYPDRVLNIVVFDGNGYGGGPFGSNIVQVNNTFDRSEDNTIWAVAHEIAHMYWGWNRVVDATNAQFSWLCLGMGLWTDLQYMDAQKKTGQHGNILCEYTDAVKEGLNTQLFGMTPADRQNRMDENPLAHGKGYQIILTLEHLFGADAVKTIARTTLERYAHQPVAASDFQAICQEITGQNLEWFFHEWLYTDNHVDYAVKDVKMTESDDGRQFTVFVEPKGGIAMPADVMLEYEDGSGRTQRLARDQREAAFAADQTWRRVIVDPKNALPDTDRSNNTRANPAVPPALEILAVDLGDRAWGLNCMKVQVRNRTSYPRTLFMHIGGRVPGATGFGMAAQHVLEGNEQRWVELWYWLSPGHGTFDAKVRFVDSAGSPNPFDEPPMLTKQYSITFPLPNDRCNDLVITNRLPIFKQFYPHGIPPIEPFKYLATEHFVFYASPGTLAYAGRQALAEEEEAALTDICGFLGTRPSEKIVVFYYPDPITKRMCTMHEGDGYAKGNTIAEVYSDKVHLDPYHELTHVVAGQLGDPPALFNEGLAVWMQKGHLWQGEAVDATAAKLMKGDRLVPLAQLLEREEIGSREDDGQVAYPESASFVGFLIRTYGKEKFLRAYARLKNGHDIGTVKQNIAGMEKIFGQKLEQMEDAWRQSLIQG